MKLSTKLAVPIMVVLMSVMRPLGPVPAVARVILLWERVWGVGWRWEVWSKLSLFAGMKTILVDL